MVQCEWRNIDAAGVGGVALFVRFLGLSTASAAPSYLVVVKRVECHCDAQSIADRIIEQEIVDLESNLWW